MCQTKGLSNVHRGSHELEMVRIVEPCIAALAENRQALLHKAQRSPADVRYTASCAHNPSVLRIAIGARSLAWPSNVRVNRRAPLLRASVLNALLDAAGAYP
jgi:hypothetical protein